ncbi:hypothetical protein M1N24_01155 [Dehalococcoidia bacterium]|nr:hypothetical protein [Dehalococcoidia bacterium]
MRDPFSFEDYWVRLLETSAMGGPSVEEAKRDYQTIEQCKSLVAYY